MFTALSREGTLAASAFRVGTVAADANDRIIYDQATGKIYYDADGSGAGGKALFAQVTAGTVLTNGDFIAFADDTTSRAAIAESDFRADWPELSLRILEQEHWSQREWNSTDYFIA